MLCKISFKCTLNCGFNRTELLLNSGQTRQIQVMLGKSIKFFAICEPYSISLIGHKQDCKLVRPNQACGAGYNFSETGLTAILIIQKIVLHSWEGLMGREAAKVDIKDLSSCCTTFIIIFATSSHLVSQSFGHILTCPRSTYLSFCSLWPVRPVI